VKLFETPILYDVILLLQAVASPAIDAKGTVPSASFSTFTLPRLPF